MDGIAWASSAMVAARTRLDVATENLANVSTDGFQRIDARGFLTATGVAIERRRSTQHGALRSTGRDFDLAIVGDGAFSVRDSRGTVTRTRDGAFTRERDGTLRDSLGRTLLGAHGALHVPAGARIDERGRAIAGGRVIDRIALPDGSSVRAGFLENSAADAISEMIDVLAASRSFESAEKVVAAIDSVRHTSAADVGSVK